MDHISALLALYVKQHYSKLHSTDLNVKSKMIYDYNSYAAGAKSKLQITFPFIVQNAFKKAL